MKTFPNDGLSRCDYTSTQFRLSNYVGWRISTLGVTKTDSIVMRIQVEVNAALQSNRITISPPPQPRRVIPSPMVRKPGLLIALHPRIPIPFRRRLDTFIDGLIRRAAIGVILFVGDDATRVVQLQAGRAKMVAELVADKLHG